MDEAYFSLGKGGRLQALPESLPSFYFVFGVNGPPVGSKVATMVAIFV